MVTETYPHLDQAPISEAILDIGVEADAPLEATDAFAKRVAETYPEASPVFTVEAFFSVNPGKSGVAGSQSAAIGKICWNPDKTRAVQARTNGFTMNHVKRYDSWKELRAEAVPRWDEYVDAIRPKKVVRLALRYINRIRLPADGDLNRYMRTHPQIGAGLSQEAGNFFMRVEIPFPEKRVAVITEAAVPREADAVERDLILNVDAVTVREFEPRDPAIWNELDELREIKNKCFFGSLQEQTWRKYQ